MQGVETWFSWDTNPLYAVLHESIYCQGAASQWAAQRVRDASFADAFDALKAAKQNLPVMFTGRAVPTGQLQLDSHLPTIVVYSAGCHFCDTRKGASGTAQLRGCADDAFVRACRCQRPSVRLSSKARELALGWPEQQALLPQPALAVGGPGCSSILGCNYQPGVWICTAGEMIFPWMFDEFAALHSMKGAAELLAARTDWPCLYDLGILKSLNVPVAAACYFEDMCAPSPPC